MQIPMTVAFDQDMAQPPQHRPALVYAYGCYGHCLPTTYAPEYQILLEKGFLVVRAHVRGGGELGRRWHAEGSGSKKEQAILDLISCLDHLITEGWTRAGKIGLHVTSAGGILLGNVLNRRPELLGAAIARSPFFDLLDTMSNPTAFLTAHEYEEWGNPNSSPIAYDQVKSICPIATLVRPITVPVLISAFLDDTRVPFSGLQKWLTKVQTISHGQDDVVLLGHTEGGHFGYEADIVGITAKEIAFLFDSLSVN